MILKSQVSAVLNKKMDRQNFIKHVALGVVAMSGASAVLRLLGPKQSPSVSAAGYGSSAYGGGNEKQVGRS